MFGQNIFDLGQRIDAPLESIVEFMENGDPEDAVALVLDDKHRRSPFRSCTWSKHSNFHEIIELFIEIFLTCRKNRIRY